MLLFCPFTLPKKCLFLQCFQDSSTQTTIGTMSDLNTNATVTLMVNGRQAREMLDQLKAKANQLETAIDKARRSGDKATLKSLKKELRDTNQLMKQIQSSEATAEQVLKRLDQATPRQLNQTLAQLRKQLNSIERGSEAWNAQVAKIKLVKAELARVNAELREGESRWSRFNRIVNDWQTTIMGAAAAVTGLVMAGRSAVKAYAEMEEELANTRKYTGLAAEEVQLLNEEFKKMDTRTPREQLNELAQEAGRLGKNTIEDVKGYVEAADIINVALVDLGEGATQTIAKLANIFRVEEEMGTRDAMLSVGSAVNVLSQNCTASKQYLVEFTQRMAGVGAQAGLTIPQLLAFGATLDANGQKTEMSASALGKLTMMLFQRPTEVAKQVGIDVEKFTEALKRSTNEGLLMFLDRIRQLGSKDGLAVLAPLFKDLGMDGVRMSQVLATLAEHLDMVTWEQQEANKAFREATSASNEYLIFNTTVQAGLDKARKRIKELSVELGEKLMPVMRHVMTSTTLILKLLSTVVDFVAKHRVAIISATAAVVAYNVALNISNIRFKVQYAWLVLTEKATIAYQAAQKGLHAVTVAMQYAVAKLTGNYARQQLLMGEMKKNAAALANVYALVAAAVVAAGVAIIASMNRQSRAQKMLADIEKEARLQSGEQVKQMEILKAVIEDETVSIHNRRAAIEELQKIIPSYHASITEEGKLIGHNAEVLKYYTEQLKNQAKIQAALSKLPEAEERAREIQRGASDRLTNALVYEKTEGLSAEEAAGKAGASPAAYKAWKAQYEEANAEVKLLNNMIDTLTKQNQELADKANAAANAGAGDNGDNDAALPPSSDKDKANKDKFAKEKEWREQQQAIIRIAYAKGETDFEAYQKRLEEIEVEFNERKLRHTDLTETERLTIEADYQEAILAQKKAGLKRTREEEDRSFSESLAILQQRYVDGELSTEAYNSAMQRLELEHARRVVDIYQDGTKERLAAEQDYQNKLFADAQRRRKKYEEEEKKHQDKLKKLKDDYFGLSLIERQQGMAEDLAALRLVYNDEIQLAGNNAREKLRIEEAYQKARAAIIEKYGGTQLNGMQRANQAIVDWMNSDGGEAVLESFDTVVSGMSAIFSGLSDIVQSELEIQTAAIEQRYNAELSFAEGNTYKVNKLERQKEAEIAKAKNEANRKMFAMQVIQAVAQTAQNALAAYGSAAQVPIVGYILAPIAAAMAVAAGAIQIAAIKKQQQASEAQGYAEGGFTPEGGKYEVKGVVHAGEWVASQRLLQSPVARPMIEALDYAQRTNTIGSLRSEDVSRSITAPTIIAEQTQKGKLEAAMTANAAAIAAYAETMRKLGKRLNEPFVTVNTVEGDTGIKRAQEEYEQLMRNKTGSKS